jgi:hypothetical protein
LPARATPFLLLKNRSELSGLQDNLRRLGALDYTLHLQFEIRAGLRNALLVRDQSKRAFSDRGAISALKKAKNFLRLQDISPAIHNGAHL